MVTQQPTRSIATAPLFAGSERRFLDNEASRRFRGSGQPRPQRGQIHQRTYVPTSSAAIDPPPPTTEYRLQRDSSMAGSAEPWPSPPAAQFFSGRFFMPAETSDRSPETISSEPRKDTSLVQAILDMPEKNIERVDGRDRTPIPIISGARASVTLEADQKIAIDTSSLLVLSHLSLVREVFRTFQDIVLASGIDSELQESIRVVSTDNPILGEQIEEILSNISKSIESRRASIVQQSAPETRVREFEFNRPLEDKLVLMASQCDVVCIDDPRFNCRESLHGNDHRNVPVACTADLLRALMETDTITKQDYWLARHQLREFGFTAVIPDAEELHYWLKESFREDHGLRESIELRTIRHSIALVAQNCTSNMSETNALLQVSTEACGEAINSLWSDETIPIQEATLGSDWIWDHVSPLRYLGGLSLTSNTIRMTMVRLLAYCFVPQERKENREGKYVEWVENSILPIFECANSRIIDESLDLIADSILDGDQYDHAYGHMFMKQLPSSLANRLLKRRPMLGDTWGFNMSRLISFDSGPSIPLMDLIENTRRAYADKADVSFLDDSGRQGVVSLDQEHKSISIGWTDEQGRERKIHMPQLALLCPSENLRVSRSQSIIQFLGATVGDKLQLLDGLVSRPATDEEVSQISNEFSNGVKALQDKLYGRVIYHKNIDVDDVIPPSMEYFERLVGPHARDMPPDSFVQEAIIPYRKRLLSLDLRSGLEIACLGFLSDSLAPGEWVKDFSNDDVWEALSGFNHDTNPFVLLAALDVALYRQKDERYQGLATMAVNVLCDRSFGRSDTFDTYDALHVVIELVENRFNTLDSGAIKPGIWKRMGAWMQAALFVGYLAKDGSTENMDSLKEFGACNMTVAGRYARIAGARVEPLAFAARTTGDLLHTYLIERLVLLLRRHERLGHQVPELKREDDTLPSLDVLDESTILGLPGPLDGHRIPTKNVPPELAVAHLAGADPYSADFPWQSFVTLSQTHELDARQITVFRAAVWRLLTVDAEIEKEHLMQRADYASMVAAACRDSVLADAVAGLIVRLVSVAHEPSQLAQMIGCLLQTAAAHSDQSAWSGWLEDKLAQMANQLPPPPSDSSRAFADLLDELGSVLPVDSWVHLRARAICGCIAPAAPRFRTDFIEEGWLDDALAALQGIREEALVLGFDVPSDIVIRSARAFLESLAQVVRQTPDVQPLQDGEIGIDFYNQTERGGALFVIESDGSGACYTVGNGVSRTFDRSSYEDLLDNEICEAVTSAGVG